MKRMSGSGKFEVIPIDEEIRNGSQEEDDNATERDPLRIGKFSLNKYKHDLYDVTSRIIYMTMISSCHLFSHFIRSQEQHVPFFRGT